MTTTPEDRDEKEANEFALHLLMPDSMFLPDWEKYKDRPDVVSFFAKRYQVDEVVVAARLMQMAKEKPAHEPRA